MLSRGGREGEEEVTGGKVNYDLMLENIIKGGYHGVRINLRVQVLICQSCAVASGGTENLYAPIFHGTLHAVNATKLQICAFMMKEKNMCI